MYFKKVKWSNEFSIGNVEIDKDHKKLIEVYNNLIDLIELNGSREEFARILSKMKDYSLKHFKREEDYMEKFEYPKLEEHRNYHCSYTYKVAIYNTELLSASPPDPEEIIHFLEKWWTTHILSIDFKYEDYKKKVNSNAEYNTFL